MGDSMFESVFRFTREGQPRFLGPTEQGASTQQSFQPKHDKISHNISSQISGNKRLPGSYANPSGQDEHALKPVGTLVDQGSKGNQLRPPKPQGIETELPAGDSRINGELHNGFNQARLQNIQETKVETNTQAVPITATRPSQLQGPSLQGNGIPIPRSKTKRWWIAEDLRHPLLTVLELENRKQGVIGNLKEAVDNHKILQHCTQFIDYKACMVGPTPNESRPSILLFCREKDQKQLEKLLDPTFLFHINCRSPYRSKLLPRPSVLDNPTFWIYVFPSNSNPTQRFAGPPPAVVSLKTSSASSLCGALVEYQGQVATIGLTVEVGGFARLLTVDHIFHEDVPEIHFEEQGEDDDSSWDYDSEDEDDEVFSAAHYDLSQNDAHIPPASSSHEEDGELASKSHAQAHDPNDTNIHLSNAEEQHTNQGHGAATRLTGALTDPEIVAHRVHNQNRLSRRRAYLDWACLELDVDTPEVLSKSCISTDPDKVPILLEEVEDFPPSHATSVLMISGIHGTRQGTLLPEPSYLGSLPGQDMCRVWTLVLNSPLGLVPGECGAIVIDKNTHKVYGHVIGANVLGHAHVVPLREVLNQMKIAFGTDLVHLPCRSSPPASPELLGSDEDQDLLEAFEENEFLNLDEDDDDILIRTSLSHGKSGDRPSLERDMPSNQNEGLSSRRTHGNVNTQSNLWGTKRGRDSHSKGPRSKSTLAPSTKYTVDGPARPTMPSYSNVGSFFDGGTGDLTPKYVTEALKRREYAMGHTGVASPDPRRPNHERVMQAASKLPAHTRKTSPKPAAYATQINFDGSDDESYGAGPIHGSYGSYGSFGRNGHNGHNGDERASSYYSSPSSTYYPHASVSQQPSPYYTTTSSTQGSGLYYSHISHGQGGSTSEDHSSDR